MRYNLPERAREFAVIGRLLGEEMTGLGEIEAAQKAIAAVERLREDIGIPTRLSQLGVTEAQLPGFAEKAFGIKRILRVNPRAVTVEALEGILRSAL
jgi:alcohol dehydrogenase class IV